MMFGGHKELLMMSTTTLDKRCTHVFSVGTQGLDINCLDLVVVRPDDLATAVHGRYWLLPPNLDQGSAFIVPQGHTATVVALSQSKDKKHAYGDAVRHIMLESLKCVFMIPASVAEQTYQMPEESY